MRTACRSVKNGTCPTLHVERAANASMEKIPNLTGSKSWSLECLQTSAEFVTAGFGIVANVTRRGAASNNRGCDT